MKNKLYFETFKQQEKNFEMVWKEYPLELKPTWHHYWFYRFLQISPSYIFEHQFRRLAYKNKKVIDKIGNEKIVKNFKSEFHKFFDKQYDELRKKKNITLPETRLALWNRWNNLIHNLEIDQKVSKGTYELHQAEVEKTYTLFDDIWSYDFIDWWYLRGVHIFKNRESESKDVFEYYNFHTPKELYKRDDEFLEGKVAGCFSEHLLMINKDTNRYDVYGSNSLPINNLQKANSFFRNYTNTLRVGISFPIGHTKKETLKLFNKYLKDNIIFPNPTATTGIYKIQKTNMQEIRISSSYKVLELRSYQSKIKLKELAEKANLMTTTLAGYKKPRDQDHRKDSLNSLRSGTCRQLSTALKLAENAAEGKFPCIDKPLISFQFDFDELRKIFNRLNSQHTSKVFDKKKTMDHLQKKIEIELKRKPPPWWDVF